MGNFSALCPSAPLTPYFGSGLRDDAASIGAAKDSDKYQIVVLYLVSLVAQ